MSCDLAVLSPLIPLKGRSGYSTKMGARPVYL
jgi:hypothetical protein